MPPEGLTEGIASTVDSSVSAIRTTGSSAKSMTPIRSIAEASGRSCMASSTVSSPRLMWSANSDMEPDASHPTKMGHTRPTVSLTTILLAPFVRTFRTCAGFLEAAQIVRPADASRKCT